MFDVISTAFNRNFFSEMSAAYQSVKAMKETEGGASQEDLTRVAACALKIFGSIGLVFCVPRVFTVSSRPIFTMLSVALHFFMAMDCLRVSNNLNAQDSEVQETFANMFQSFQEAIDNKRGFSLQGKSPVLQEISNAIAGTYILQPLFESAMRAHDIFKSKLAITGESQE